ncbi:MAG: hypothetical protein CYPHOPRED_000662 [Cyphobasidiales sp. Tagirdzhanova-0007]|nr:MAG: hypothetical protein CYPHOPRED_000662 [Cyphobasidiales sp. Tagirdzhanova-0007]
MKIYESSHKNDIFVPEVDAWDKLLGPASLRVPDDKVMLIDAITGKTTTIGAARELALRLADGMRSTAGLKTGDVICIFSPNSVLYPVVCMASQAASVVPSLANSTSTPKELLHQLKDSKVVLLFASSDIIDTAKEAAKEAGLLADRVYALPGGDGKIKQGTRSWEELISNKLWKHESIPKSKLKSTPAFIPYSSGTTGLAKGVVITHSNLIGVSAMLHEMPGWYDKSTILLATLPMFHIFGLVVTFTHVIHEGGAVVVMPRFDLGIFLSSISKYKCTVTCIVPPIALALAKHPMVEKADFSTIKFIISGAAPLSASIQDEAMKRIKAPIVIGFGMTETVSCSTVNLQEKNKLGSIGPLLPGQRARIVDDSGEDVPLGEQGELWLHGPNIFFAYLNNPGATHNSITSDGWFKTGDVAFVDDEGYFTIVDRSKELIKYKGSQVAPAELEALLLQSELVADAAVIGVYTESEATELPRAYVVLSPKGKEHKAAGKAIADYVVKHCAPHKRLRGGVYPIDVIPKSMSGKILRKDLRLMAAQEGKSQAKL